MNIEDLYIEAARNPGLCTVFPFRGKKVATKGLTNNEDYSCSRLRVLNPQIDWDEFIEYWETYRGSEEDLKRQAELEGIRQAAYERSKLPFWKKLF